MGFIGVQPASAPLTSSDIADGIVTKSKIANDSIDNTKLDLTDDYAFTGTITGAGQSLRPNSKPLIINGDMAVAQRSSSTASITSDGYHTLDRFETHISSLGTWTQSQDTDVPSGQGFANSLKMDVTSADASPSAGDYCVIRTKFEGQDLQLFKKGTSSAEKFTLAFWVKSSKTGTHIVELFDIDNSRTVSQAYTISSADTWEKKVVNFPADTTGAFGDDNGRSLDIQFWLGAGSNFTSGTLQTTWAGQTNANRIVGQVNLADNTSNNWYITGVQLEVGEFTSATLPAFQHESFGNNLARCHRYFQYSHFLGGFRRAILKGVVNQAQVFVDFPIMRTSAALTLYGDGANRLQSGKIYYDSGGLNYVSPNEVGAVGPNGFYINLYSPTSANYYLDGYEVSAEL